MGGETLIEKAEIEREGVLRPPSGVGGYIYPWIQQGGDQHQLRDNETIAMSAQDMGYKYGDTVKYKIIIEPKS